MSISEDFAKACILSMHLIVFVQVQLSQIRDPVHNQYQQLPSNYFSKFLPWQEQQPCKLKLKIEYEEYPPCIHMDVTFDDPAVRPEVVTALKICTSCNPANNLALTMKVPSELLLIMAIACESPG